MERRRDWAHPAPNAPSRGRARGLDEDGLHDKVEAVREDLKALDEERQSGDPLATAACEVLGLLEAADLPLVADAGEAARLESDR